MDDYRLVYCSRSLIHLAHDNSLTVVRNIFSKLVIKNERRNITGFLLIDIDSMAQIFEGARSDINDLYKTIERDNRHTDVKLLEFRSILNRCFSKWSMAGSIRMQRHIDIYLNHGISGALKPECLSPGIIVSLGKGLLAHQSRQAAFKHALGPDRFPRSACLAEPKDRGSKQG